MSTMEQDLAQANADCNELKAEVEKHRDALESSGKDFVRLTNDYLTQKAVVEGLEDDVDFRF